MSSENVELAHIAYDVAYVRRSIEGYEDRFTDDFTWHQRAEWPGRSVYPRDELTTLWEGPDGPYPRFTVEAGRVRQDLRLRRRTVHTSARLRTSDHRIDGVIW